MKTKILLLIFYLFSPYKFYSQGLSNILDGYTLSKIPTNKSIVGAKWVEGLGATSEGLSEEKLTVSESLNELSLDKNNQLSLGIALLSNLGLSGYNASDVKVIFNKLDIYTIKNLYELPLSKGEKFVFSSIKVASFDLEYSDKLSSMVSAKLAQGNLPIDAKVDINNKKRISINGADLFIAHKIVKVDKVDSKTITKRLKNEFGVKDIMDYNIYFNTNLLVNHAVNKTIEEIGLDNYNQLSAVDSFIRKYSKISPIVVNIISPERGNLNNGIFNKDIEICYCELLGENKKLYPINMVNSGDKITFDYLFVDNLWIHYKLLNGVTSRDSKKTVGLISTSDNSKISVISKTFYLSKIDK